MNLIRISSFLISIILLALSTTSCEENTTTIGSSIAGGEVEISIDTIEYKLDGKAKAIENFDSKTGNLMIGNIQSENYGSLNCSFVTRLMCASKLNVADSLFSPERVDSCKLIFGAQRGDIIGDSLAPQRLTVYKLTEQLPSDINNAFNPDNYYDPAYPLASQSYTVSEISSSDSAFYNNRFIGMYVDLPVEFGKEIFQKYKEEPSIFQWPQTMAKEFLPGIYVKSTFGKGCIANIQNVFVAVYYYNLAEKTVINDGDTTVTVQHITNMAVPFTVSPEVLSSNNISYKPSDKIIQKNSITDNNGEIVITTPGGYIGEFLFPAEDLLERYRKKNTHLSTVNDLNLYIPAETFDATDGIGVASNILLIKSSEYEEFFEKNKVPDNKTSFTGAYDSNKKRYYFSSLREYFLELLKKDTITQEDISFIIVPVELETETSNSYYNDATYITKCSPLISKPTMTLLKTNEAVVTFSFSTQMIQ